MIKANVHSIGLFHVREICVPSRFFTLFSLQHHQRRPPGVGADTFFVAIMKIYLRMK
jgi:hypothetical protein